MKHTLKDLYRRICNVIRWLPTIWNDKDYDDSFIVEILIKKLEFTRDFYLSNKAYSAEALTTVDEIQTAINLLHMTQDPWEFYEEPAMDVLEEKWGKGIIRFEQHDNGMHRLHIDYPNVKTLEDNEQRSAEFSKAHAKAFAQYKKDKQKAYKYIATHIDRWWD
jgi:hypothetical protein